MISELVDQYFDLQRQIFEHVGYVEDWTAYPMEDQRGNSWRLDSHNVTWAESIEAMPADDEDELDGEDAESKGDYYTAELLYNHRVPESVYRGAELTLIRVDTNSDNNRMLLIFSNDHEVADSE